jgi:CMP-N-acetylneuraminic acid synthetase
MIQNKRILAVIPARGGSKGIPLKNLRKINNKTLIEHASNIANQILEIDKTIISTDHDKIIEHAKNIGLEVPFIRPDEISTGMVGDWVVLNHALQTMEKIDNQQYDIIVMLQPTSPLRKAEQVISTINKLINESWDSVLTVSLTDPKMHPIKQLTIDEKGKIDYYHTDGAKILYRQQQSSLYHKNGIAYVLTRECILEQKAMFGKKTGALIVEGEYPSIDTEWDLLLADFIYKSLK